MTPATNHEHDPRGASVTPYDRLTAALPDSHDGPIGVVDSADLRAVLADAQRYGKVVQLSADMAEHLPAATEAPG